MASGKIGTQKRRVNNMNVECLSATIIIALLWSLGMWLLPESDGFRFIKQEVIKPMPVEDWLTSDDKRPNMEDYVYGVKYELEEE